MTAAGPTFPCPSCGAPISGPPGQVMPCPFCRSNVVAPGVADTSRKEGPFTTDVRSLAVGFEPAVGFALVGAHMPPGEPPRVRAYNLYNKKLAWDALMGEAWISEATSVALRGRSVYVTDYHTLVALDLTTGKRRWTTDLPAKVAPFCFAEWAPRIHDSGTLLLVATDDRGLAAVDRETGALRWTRRYQALNPYWGESGPLVRGGATVVAHDRKVADVIAPSGEIVAHVEDSSPDSTITRCDVDDDHALLQVEGWSGGKEGIVVVDLRAPRPQFFAMRRPFLKCNSVCIDGRAYVATDVGTKLRTRGDVAAAPPAQGYQFMALVRAQGTLVALLWNSDVAPYVRRIVWLDPATLAERFEGTDLGAIDSTSSDWWMHNVETDGRIVAAVASPRDDKERCEIRAFDPSNGRAVWTRPVGAWLRHEIQGGYVVVRTAEAITVLRPDSGEPIATYP